MLDHLIDIYLHLDTKTLAAALANDQRSFSGVCILVSYCLAMCDCYFNLA